MKEQLGDFQVGCQELEELTSAMELIKFRKEISQQLHGAAALWKYASSISSPEEFLKCISKETKCVF